MQQHANAEEDRAAELTPAVRAKAPWRVARVEVLPGYRLRVIFNDGTNGMVEMEAFLDSPDAGVFEVLRDEAVFREVKFELGAVTWPGDLDLAPDAMHKEIAKHGKWVVR
ncbi:MAG TPA: DUF2442 domain-containing protein [Rhizomicrobium sp.]|jgi:hypothetical protein